MKEMMVQDLKRMREKLGNEDRRMKGEQCLQERE
jgi:hypothetical protein